MPGVISFNNSHTHLIIYITIETVGICDNQRISYIYIENICVQIPFLLLNNFPGYSLALVAVCNAAY